jgi:AcrR family transcriptional regulator
VLQYAPQLEKCALSNSRTVTNISTNSTIGRTTPFLEVNDRSCYFQGMAKQKAEKTDSPTNESRRSAGQLSRATILLTAAKLVTVKGLEGLSIGELAAEVGMSKSGLYAHFKSKEELDLATIETAATIFDREVLQPAMAAPAGLRRVRALADSFLLHLERKVFPGGCFFAAVLAELDTRPGLARDRVSKVLDAWLTLLTQCFADAQANGEIRPQSDIAQAAFETEGMLLTANFLFVMRDEITPLNQARQGLENVLTRLAANPTSRKKRSPG